MSQSSNLSGKRVLLIISGGIAAYKSLELIRRLRERGATVRCILTEAAQTFVTPLSVATLAGEKAYTDLFSLTDELEIGHIRLGREADLVVVAPATADLMAKMALGQANDLASATLLAASAPVLVAPAMNTRMWHHPATQRNLAQLEADGVLRVGPNDGPLAEGESGPGRMAEPPEILAAIEGFFSASDRLAGLHALVTSGPTYEPIDPVRFIGNRSSGKQGHAIAAACARRGARVTLVSGPTQESDPLGVTTVHVETAAQMLAACEDALPADVAVCAAAVSDWRVAAPHNQKLKKGGPGETPGLDLVENPDILARLSRKGAKRPRLVVGFAAETENVVAHAMEKLARKGCDWIVANDVSPSQGTFGGDRNTVHVIAAATGASQPHVESWPLMSKTAVADRLAIAIADAVGRAQSGAHD